MKMGRPFPCKTTSAIRNMFLWHTLFMVFLFNSYSSPTSAQARDIDSLNGLAKQQYTDAHFDKLFTTQNKIKAYYLSQKDTDNIVLISIRMADAFRANSDFLSGLETLNDIENSLYAISNQNLIGICVVKGSIFYELNEIDSCLHWANLGIETSLQKETSLHLPLLYNLVGSAYTHINQDSALKYMRLSIHIFLNHNDSTGMVLPLINASRILMDKKLYAEAEKELLFAIEILDQTDVKTYRKMAYEQLGILYGKTFHYEDALKYIKLRDSVNFEINNHRTDFAIAKLKADVKTAKARQEKNAFKAKIAVGLLKNRNNKLIITLSGVVILTLGLFLYIAINSSRTRKVNNRLLKALNVDLQTRSNELAALHSKLKQRNADLEELNQFKNEILSIIGHDTRAPLAQVITFLQAKEAGISLSDHEVKKMDQTILANAQNGLLVLDNLLKWANSQIETVKLNHEPKDTSVLIENVIQQVASLSKAKNLKISTDLKKSQLETDVDLYQIVLRNLLSNAIKFSPQNAEILIQSECTEDAVLVHITDQGPGIPQSVITMIQKGKKAVKPEAGSSGEKGAGLGLNLSMNFAQRIGGEIYFEHILNHGTKATLRTPFAYTSTH